MSSETQQTNKIIIALGLAAGAIAAMQVGKVPPALPLIAADLELSRVASGLVASLFFAAGALLGVTMGGLADRFGELSLMYIGLAILALSSLIGGLVADSAALLATRITEGLGYTCIVVSAPKIIAAAARSRDIPLALGIWSTFMPTGMAFVIVLSPAMIGALGWQGVWFINAGLIVAFAGLLAVVLGTGKTTRRMAAAAGVQEGGSHPVFDWPGVRRLLARPGPWLFAFCFTLYTIQWFAIMAWLPTFLIESQGRGLAAASYFAALVVAGNILGNLAAGWLMQRGVARWTLIAIAFVVMAITGALIFSTGVVSPDAKIPLAFIFSALGGLLPASCIAGSVAHAPSSALNAMANGFAIQGSTIGSLAGPPVLGALAAIYGNWENFWWALLVGPAIGLGFVAMLRSAERRMAAAK